MPPKFHLTFSILRKVAIPILILGVMGGLSGCLAKRNVYEVPEVGVAGAYHNRSPLEPGLPDAVGDKGQVSPGGAKDGAGARQLENGSDVLSDGQSPPAKFVSGDDGFVEWWRYFGSPELNRLMDRALANNPDLRIATLRLVQAKESEAQTAAGRVPSLSVPMVVARQAPGGSVGVVPTGGPGAAQNAVQASLRADWRADVWGEQAAMGESAGFQVRRAGFERDNTQSGLVASLAASYVDYLTLNDRIRLARETERVLSSTLSVLERRVAMGDATLTDLEQQKALVYGLRATLPSLEQQREDALSNIALMVGALPGELVLGEEGLDSLQLPSIEPGLPSSLLLRRPDIRMMEARMLAADADIDVARARLMPSVDLSSQVGMSSAFLTPLFQPSVLFWNVIASLSASIFDGGRREHAKKYSEAVYAEMVETYIKTIHQAMRDVENSLVVVRLSGRRMNSQREAAAAAYRAWQIGAKVFAMGGMDLSTLLDVERNYHRYSDDYQKARAESLKGSIALFHALGGGVRVARLPDGGRAAGLGDPSGGVRTTLEAEEQRAVDYVGVDQSGDGAEDAGGGWQVELNGLYHRSTVGAAWRDLQIRFPKIMAARTVLPRLVGKAEDRKEGGDAWYQIRIASFPSAEEAAYFCRQLQVQRDRCRIVSAQSGKEAQEVGMKASALTASEAIASPKEVRE